MPAQHVSHIRMREGKEDCWEISMKKLLSSLETLQACAFSNCTINSVLLFATSKTGAAVTGHHLWALGIFWRVVSVQSLPFENASCSDVHRALNSIETFHVNLQATQRNKTSSRFPRRKSTQAWFFLVQDLHQRKQCFC